tara:strand:- start:3735 stop:3836 length:102 start_codon:yes stop_codon:yes gene_type:complete
MKRVRLGLISLQSEKAKTSLKNPEIGVLFGGLK